MKNLISAEEATQEIESRIEALEGEWQKVFTAADTQDKLDIARVALLGLESPLEKSLELMRYVPVGRRVLLGERVSKVHREVVEGYRTRVMELRP